MVNPNRFYTYAYLREDRTPYYIGKGQTHRLLYKPKTGDVRPPKDKSRIIFLKQNLIEEEAFKHEIYMIAVFGRKDLGTGILRNRTNGGEGSSGRIESEELKRKKSEMMKGKYVGEKNSMYGKSHSQETIQKLREIQGGKNNPMYGKSHSDETRRKQSEARKGKLRSEESRKKQSETRKGMIHLDETKRKQSEVKKGENNPNYGKKWWNDGCGNCKMMIECPGDGWISGRGKRKKVS